VNSDEKQLEIINDMLVISDLNNAIRSYVTRFMSLGDAQIHDYLYESMKIINEQYRDLEKELKKEREKPIKAMKTFKVLDKSE
jgi:hypothetical protein